MLNYISFFKVGEGGGRTEKPQGEKKNLLFFPLTQGAKCDFPPYKSQLGWCPRFPKASNSCSAHLLEPGCWSLGCSLRPILHLPSSDWGVGGCLSSILQPGAAGFALLPPQSPQRRGQKPGHCIPVTFSAPLPLMPCSQSSEIPLAPRNPSPLNTL